MNKDLPLRALGTSTLMVSAPSFGAMRLSTAGRPDRSTARQVLRAALDAGVTMIDTSDAYGLDSADCGHNEYLIAETLCDAGNPDWVLVATKGGVKRPGGAWEPDGRPEAIRSACENSLRRLRTETLGLYYLQKPDSRVPIEDSVGALADLRRAGKVRFVGLSNVSLNQLQAAMAEVTVTAVQNRFSVLYQVDLDNGTIPFCARNDIAYVVANPVGGRNRNHLIPRVPVIAEIAARLGATPHAVALSWLCSISDNTIPLIGATRLESLLDGLSSTHLQMSPNETAAIRAMSG
ncbi:aldo/keto reductase [Rhodobacterales bacterium]|nr:aldo/keto reductase [Rhodobacterales bacterium]